MAARLARRRVGGWRGWIARLVVALGLGAGMMSEPARAQGGVTGTPPYALSARLLDGAGAPVADAEVYVVQLDRTVRTGTDGVFRITPVAPGRYEVGIRRVGFLPRSVTIAARMGTIAENITLVAYTTRLAPVITAATRGGLSGVVADTAYQPVANAQVRVAGSGRTARTDSAGRFFVDLRAGSYLVGIERAGFARQTVAVRVPKDSGREIAVWLSPRRKADRAVETMEQVRLFGLDQRMIRASAQSSHYFTRDELLALGMTDLSRLARQWAQGPITALCTVSIENDGGRPYQVPLNSVETEAIEFVEVYQRSPGRAFGMGTSPYCGNLALLVWLRQ